MPLNFALRYYNYYLNCRLKHILKCKIPTVLSASLWQQERPEQDSNPDLIIYHLIIDPHNDQLPIGLMARLVDHCTGITEVRV